MVKIVSDSKKRVCQYSKIATDFHVILLHKKLFMAYCTKKETLIKNVNKKSMQQNFDAIGILKLYFYFMLKSELMNLLVYMYASLF